MKTDDDAWYQKKDDDTWHMKKGDDTWHMKKGDDTWNMKKTDDDAAHEEDGRRRRAHEEDGQRRWAHGEYDGAGHMHMADEKGDDTGHQKGDDTGRRRAPEEGRRHGTPEDDDEMSIMEIMDERREAALHEGLEDALREHVGSAKRRKKRTRTGMKIQESRLQESESRLARGELPEGEEGSAKRRKVRTRATGWEDAEARWEDAQSALRWEASLASHEKGSLRYEDHHGLSGRCIVELNCVSSGSD